jgi:phosphate transport system substrate-binding protein
METMFSSGRRDMAIGIGKKGTVPVLFFALGLFFLSLPEARGVEEMKISGTGGALAGVRLLADAFNRTYPDMHARVLPLIGCTGGIKAVIGGSLDLSVSGRPLKNEERSAGAIEIPYAKTPFVFAAHKSVPVSRITLKDAVDIYEGKKTVWSDGTPVRLVLRHKGESDFMVLRDISAEMSIALDKALRRKGMIVASTDVDNADILEKTPGTIGTTNLSLILSENRRIRVLAMGEVNPSVETLSGGSYPYAKTFFFITGKTVTPATGKFIDFVFSPKGVSILERTGHVVIPR